MSERVWMLNSPIPPYGTRVRSKTMTSAKASTLFSKSGLRTGRRCTRRPPASSPSRRRKPSVGCGKALADVLRVLQLVNQGDSIVLGRDSTRAGLVDNQIVFADAELPCAFARLN